MASRSLAVSRSGSRGENPCNLARSKNGVYVYSNGIFDSPRISARERCGHWDSTLARFFKHFTISQHQPLLRHGKSAELVFAVRVRSSNVKNNVRAEFIERRLHRRDERAEILLIVGTIPHVQIDSRRRFIRRIVVLLMDRKGKDTGIVAKNSSRAIPVVDIGINHECFPNRAIPLKAPYRNSDIVDRAESFPVIGIRVVKATAKIATEAIAQGGLRRQNRATGGQPEGFHEFR